MNWADYIPHGIAGVAVTAVGWLAKQHISYDKKTREKVSAIEVTVAALPAKEDLDRVHDRIDALGRQIADGQLQILTAVNRRHES
jgi:hypothetical protein